ncbi:MAG: FAD-dependent oxidoreductase [bacterium]
MRVAIVGCGPAGISTAAWLRSLHVPFEWYGMDFGGTLNRVHNAIDNAPPTLWPNGRALCDALQGYCDKLGLAPTSHRVQQITQTPSGWSVDALGSFEAVVLATGTQPRTWAVPGAHAITAFTRLSSAKAPDEFVGKNVVVVGGGDGAFEAALRLAEHASRIDVLIRSTPKARTAYVEDANAHPRIHVQTNAEILSAAPLGDGVVLRTNAGDVPCSAVYLKIGVEAAVPKIPSTVARAGDATIITDDRCESSAVGLFAVGDVRSTTLQSIATSQADGARAARAIADRYESIMLKTR